MLRPHQVEYVKQLWLILLSRTIWRLQGEHRRDHVEGRLIQKENGPILQMLLGTIGQHQVGQKPSCLMDGGQGF